MPDKNKQDDDKSHEEEVKPDPKLVEFVGEGFKEQADKKKLLREAEGDEEE